MHFIDYNTDEAWYRDFVQIVEAEHESSSSNTTENSTTKISKDHPFSKSMLLSLPRELRDLIYHRVFSYNRIQLIRDHRFCLRDIGQEAASNELRLLCICKQFYAEAFDAASY